MADHEAKTSVDIELIRSSINMILDHIESDLNIKAVKIDPQKEYYWDMDINERFAVVKDPPVLSIGKLEDDIEFLALMVKNADGDTVQAPALMLMHITPLLHLLCDVVRA